jgi:hypothetical protein
MVSCHNLDGLEKCWSVLERFEMNGMFVRDLYIQGYLKLMSNGSRKWPDLNRIEGVKLLPILAVAVCRTIGLPV